jgi:AAA domain
VTAVDWERLAAAAAAIRDNGAIPAVPEPAPPLEFSTLAELRVRVTAAGPRNWMLRGLWPAGDYGVHSAEQKGQKTWNVVDLTVSVASHTPWLGSIPVDDPGPVLMFHGEGSEANLVRRIHAVCVSRDINPDTLDIVICTRAPKLANTTHLDIMRDEIARTRPRLVTLDPLYLAARGGKLGDLLDMGALLEGAQHVCQDARASLFVHTTTTGKMAAVCAASLGRVLPSGDVCSSQVTS